MVPIVLKTSKILKTFGMAILLIALSVGIFLYTAGYRLSKNKNENTVKLDQTGMISTKSLPEGANVYLNGELKTATNGTIPGLEPGQYNLKIIKNGFVVWEKTVEVFPELATDITAILVSQTPRLEPLTNTGAREPTISPSLSKLAFFSKDGNAPGVWVIPLVGDALSLFRSNPYVVLEDIPGNLYSSGKSITWAPDEKSLLVESQNGSFYLVDLSNGNASLAVDANDLKQKWLEELTQKRLDFIEKLDIPSDLREIATAPSTIWAPDEKKFLYTVKNGNNTEYRVYNMEKPIPVGEKVESVVFTRPTQEKQPMVSWYSDSFHLILADVEKQPEGGQGQNRVTVSLIRIDGTNKVEVFSNNMYSDKVFSSPSGDKLILLTSFKSGDQTDLYTIGIR